MIKTHAKFGVDQIPEYFMVIGPHCPKIVTLPKVREWIWDVTYYSKRFHTIIKLRFDCYHRITFDSKVCFSHGDRPIKHYIKYTGLDVTERSETVDPEQFQHTFKQLADEVGLTNHPTIKASCFHSAEDEAFCAYVFDENQPRWMDEHSISLVHRVLTEDADPAYPIYLFSKADYASANAALFPSVSNVHDDAAAFLQYAKDHPIAGEYAVHFFQIGSPTWAQREKRRKKTQRRRHRTRTTRHPQTRKRRPRRSLPPHGQTRLPLLPLFRKTPRRRHPLPRNRTIQIHEMATRLTPSPPKKPTPTKTSPHHPVAVASRHSASKERLAPPLPPQPLLPAFLPSCLPYSPPIA